LGQVLLQDLNQKRGGKRKSSWSGLKGFRAKEKKNISCQDPGSGDLRNCKTPAVYG